MAKKDVKKKPKKEFDKLYELKYASLWLGIPVATIAILRIFGINDLVILFFVVIIVVLLIQNYLQGKEIRSLKE